MFKTLFARMLATYLSVVLGIILLLGVTVGAVFQSQYRTELDKRMFRAAEDVSETITERYMDDVKRPVAERELVTIARQYDAMIIVRFADERLGKCVFIGEEFMDKWAGCMDMDISGETDGILEGTVNAVTTTDDFVTTEASVPVKTLIMPIEKDGETAAALIINTDMSGLRESIRKAWMDVILCACVAVMTAIIAVSYITGRMTEPITAMSATVLRYSKGEFDLRVQNEGDDEVAKLGRSFNIMANELNTLEEARRSFVANVSHELRSPLTSMRGFLEAMQDGTIPPEEQPKYLDIVINENRRMTSMVNDLLDLARMESGQTVINKTRFDINDLIARTLLTFEARIDAKRLNVGLDTQDERLIVEADEGQISQVLRNLIDNAIKFTPEGGSLSLSSRADRRLACITVADSGAGIPPESLPHLFERFYKAEKAHTPNADSGTGLGLSIVKRIIDQHDQTITVQSEPGRGTSFCFTLKRAAETLPKKAAQRRS